MVVIDGKNPRSNQTKPALAACLNPLEGEIIDLFVQLSGLFGQPRSFATIYGLLFISVRPLAMDDLIERLQLSKGSASQGLKFLRNMGAVKAVAVEGDRRVHYEAVAELRNLLTRFLSDQIVPQLDGNAARLDRIANLVRQLPAAERAQINGRITMLQSWGKRGRRFLPMVAKIMRG
jgi:DNA-binding transcriptional regulator GbsR (MarR family)